MGTTQANSADTLFESATRTGKNATTIQTPHHRGVIVVVDVTASSGDATEDLAVRIRIHDPVTGKALNVITDEFTDGATGTRWYAVYPGIADTPTAFDAIAEVPAGPEVEVELETLQGGGSPDHTYSVGVLRLV